MASLRAYIINKVSVIAFLLACVSLNASAQDDVEYQMEIGGGIGMTAYQGDFSNGLFSGVQPAASVVFRRIINPYSAVRISGMFSKLKGSIDNPNNIYPELPAEGYSFGNMMGDVSCTYEYNFFPYGTGKDYHGAKRITPFISLGLGVTYVNSKHGTYDYSSPTPHSNTKSVVTGNVPLGAGVKYKIGDRTNLSLDWQMHFSFSDDLDGVKDVYGIKSSGMFKNTDCYSTLMLSLTYSFAPKCPTCQKDR